MNEFLIKTSYKKDECKELLIKNFKGSKIFESFTGNILENEIYLSYGGLKGYMDIFFYIYGIYNELSEYKSSKGAIQFPIDKPIPYELISKIVKYRVLENIKKMKVN